MRLYKRYISALLLLVAMVASGEVVAQNMPERSLVRRGNRQFDKQHYTESIDYYEKALAAAPDSFEAKFNLATALSKNRRDDKPELAERAEKLLGELSKRPSLDDVQRGEVAYNLGNVLFDGGRLKEALESYRNAMRFNPDDQDAKFNYTYTKLLLQQQEQNQDQNQDQNQQNQDQNQQQNQQDKEQEQKNDKQDKDKEQQDQQQQQQQQNQQDKQNEQQQQQQQQSGISPQEQAAMLEAIQAQEDKAQEKLKEAQGVLIRGQKNW